MFKFMFIIKSAFKHKVILYKKILMGEMEDDIYKEKTNNGF